MGPPIYPPDKAVAILREAACKNPDCNCNHCIEQRLATAQLLIRLMQDIAVAEETTRGEHHG